MNSPIKDIADHLETSTDYVVGTDLFLSYLPEIDSEVICLFDTGGSAPDPNDIQNPVVSVMVRGIENGYQSAYELMNNILAELHGMSNTVINTASYLYIWKMTEIIHVGNDRKMRPILSCTLRLSRLETDQSS